MAECSSSSNHPMEQPQTSLQVMESEKVTVDGYLSTSATYKASASASTEGYGKRQKAHSGHQSASNQCKQVHHHSASRTKKKSHLQQQIHKGHGGLGNAQSRDSHNDLVLHAHDQPHASQRPTKFLKHHTRMCMLKAHQGKRNFQEQKNNPPWKNSLPQQKSRTQHRKAQAKSLQDSTSLERKEMHVNKPEWHLPRLTIKELDEISCLSDSADVILHLEKNLKAFQLSLSTCGKVHRPQQYMYVTIILKILKRMCEAPMDLQEHRSKVLAEVLSDRCAQFHVQLKMHVCKVTEKDAQQVVEVFCKVLQILPSSAWSVLPVNELVESVQQMESLCDLAVVHEADSLKQTFDNIRLEQRRQIMKVSDGKLASWDNSQYRRKQIYPTMEEICMQNPPMLRSNLIRGAYTDWEHYYDVQFHLLREDFIAPLRRGIRDCIAGEKGKRNMDVNIYRKVRILEPVFTRDGICFNIQFDVSMFRQRQTWEHSKRLIFGSLLCLSPVSDNFKEEVYFAIVAKRDPKELTKGILQVQFQESVQLIAHCQKTVFVMAESKAYFEACRHILRSLQTAEVDTMPFTKYLVLNQPQPVDRPRYLQDDNAFYDIHHLCHAQGGSIKTRVVNVLDKQAWPSADEIELDKSQLDAIQMALTQEIAVIQGPPGTGKTYIGIKIVQTLLESKGKVGRSPILVLCYTNHALDQFLEGILDQYEADSEEVLDKELSNDEDHVSESKCRHTFNISAVPNIVRIGGRSQSERIQSLNISNVRTSLPWELPRRKKALIKTIEDYSMKIPWESLTSIQRPINESTVGPSGVRMLRKVMHPRHWYQLNTLAENAEEESYILEIWLDLWNECTPDERIFSSTAVQAKGANDVPLRKTQALVSEHQISAHLEEDKLQYQDNEGEMTSEHGSGEEKDKEVVVVEEEEEKEHGLVDVTGEAAIEELARMFDENVFQPIKKGVMNDSRDSDSNFDEGEGRPEDLEALLSTESIGSALKKGEGQTDEELWNVKERILYRQRKSQKERSKIVRQQTRCAIPMEEEEVNEVADVTKLSKEKKWSLLRYWVQLYHEHLFDTNAKMFDEYKVLCRRLTNVKQRMDRYSLEEAEIIGMTTTGAAKYQHILHLVKPRIVIVEEAAEVLESHIVSSLNAGTQHLILIGDHKQLRPKPNEYDLAKRHHLDISLFERLLGNGLPHATLLIQHRMRPEIARLVCPHIYNDLHNHPDVEMYGNVKGFKQNLYFFCHERPEKEDTHILSHSNEFEADFVAALCHHLLKQDYKPAQITILTAYSGQLLKVRTKMPKNIFEGVRITNVDNFQGEENDIIILTLVRSNSEGRVGFLKECNRVCVALSRAKVGFYCFGNFKMLRKEVPIWDTILSDMEKRNSVGSAFRIFCQNHPENEFEVKHPMDFVKFAPEGGCKEQCKHRLECGHSCARLCHNTDPKHEYYQCKKPCQRLCKREEHYCSSLCYEECPPCCKIVTRTLEPCGHTQRMRCHEEKCNCLCGKKCKNDKHSCQQQCHVDLPCKPCKIQVEREMPICHHIQTMPCYKNPASQKCLKVCQKKYPKCGHTVDMRCYEVPKQANCLHSCDEKLECGHCCQRKCGEKCSVAFCYEEVEIPLHCGHSIKAMCREVWNPKDECHAPYFNFTSPNKHIKRNIPQPIVCTMPCEKLLHCGHKCQKNCSEPCTTDCQVKVKKEWPCGHKLQRKCFETWNMKDFPCTKQCEKVLSCGHRCAKRCGEECTKSCNQFITRNCPCGHQHKLSCSYPHDQCPCTANCSRVLKCGHACSGKCGQCYTSRVHQPCKFEVEIDRFCGHYSANVPCLGIVDSCNKNCIVGCPHFSCSDKCDLPCKAIKCEHPCEWKCDHFQCSQLCYAPCDRPPCNEPCTKYLSCGHTCLGVCGEPCLSVCPQCNEKKFRSKLCLEKRARIDVSLFIQLDCGHIFTVRYLDQRFRRLSEGALICPLKCPFKKCSMAVRLVGRYFNQIKEQLKLIHEVGENLKARKSDTDDDILAEILEDNEAQSLLDSLVAPRRHHDAQRRRPLFLYPTRNPEVLFAMKVFLLVKQLHKHVKAIPVIKSAKKFTQKVLTFILMSQGRVSDQFIADVERGLLLLCLRDVIESVAPDGDVEASLSPVDYTRLKEARTTLKRIQSNSVCEFSTEECRGLLLPLEHHYIRATGQSISDLIPSIPPPPRNTKGEWYKCPAGHIYFDHAVYKEKLEIPQCPQCSTE